MPHYCLLHVKPNPLLGAAWGLPVLQLASSWDEPMGQSCTICVAFRRGPSQLWEVRQQNGRQVRHYAPLKVQSLG